ncbi:PD-(D/E)XK nuclease family transposase [Okeania sp. SIO2C9]|uniref:PD-(D/E)XK nuclease family transposase n=1 Tax=Okeania sp. SIO2C9 TaxID=2607791 RepID=UPI00345DB5AF
MGSAGDGEMGRWGDGGMGGWGVREKLKKIYLHHYHAGLPDILISFLNSILYDSHPTIKDLQILNPYLVPKIRGLKDTYLDVKAKVTGNKTVIIEMQVLNL